MENFSTSDESCGFTIYWRIENFSSESCKNKELFSPLFRIKELKSLWRLEMYQEEDNLSIYLINKAHIHHSTLSYSASLLTGMEWKTLCTKEKVVFKLFRGWGCRIRNVELEKDEWIYLPNGSLSISFHIWNTELKSTRSQCVIISRLKNNELQHRPIKSFSNLKPSDMLSFPPSYEYNVDEITGFGHKDARSYKAQFIQTDTKDVKIQSTQTHTKGVKIQSTQTDTNVDFKTNKELIKFFNEKEFRFVTLRTLSKDFSVHKAVLCAKSPVFNAMFEQKMRENDCNVVDIDDIDSDTLASLIKALHFEPVGDLTWDAAVKLYYASDKYQIDSLKAECVCLISKGLSVENVCRVFLLADMHHDKDLLKCAQEYFYKNSKLVLLSNEWRDFMCHTELAADVLCMLAKKM